MKGKVEDLKELSTDKGDEESDEGDEKAAFPLSQGQGRAADGTVGPIDPNAVPDKSRHFGGSIESVNSERGEERVKAIARRGERNL